MWGKMGENSICRFGREDAAAIAREDAAAIADELWLINVKIQYVAGNK
jgi:hypothetical protein